MIKVGVIGVGSIGRHHARVFSTLPPVRLVGVADTHPGRAEDIASRFYCKPFDDYREMIDGVDAVSIAVPTHLHYMITMDALRRGKDVLLEKPMTSTIEEADDVIREAEERNLVLQVGHIERFNAGVSLISSMVEAPRFIESRRISPFLGRSTDIDVTLDLMIHDIDIILSLVHSDISDLRATGAKVLTDHIDVAHAWIEFTNGCIAEAVTSRIANEKIRELRVFQQNAALALDYQSMEVTSIRSVEGSFFKETRQTEEKEPLLSQLESFVECLQKRTQPLVSGYEGREALKVVMQISELVYNTTL